MRPVGVGSTFYAASGDLHVPVDAAVHVQAGRRDLDRVTFGLFDNNRLRRKKVAAVGGLRFRDDGFRQERGAVSDAGGLAGAGVAAGRVAGMGVATTTVSGVGAVAASGVG